MKFNFLVVGSGLFGATFANIATEHGFKVLVIDKRKHIGGNAYTEEIDGVHVHRYGPHIFHTSSDVVWKYICKFGEFNRFVNSPIANYKGKLYSLPFTMRTFYEMWGTKTPAEAKAKIQEQIDKAGIETPKNLEEKAISLVGSDIYEKLIKGYTEKQWGRPCSKLPESIINRIPIRFDYNSNYFNDVYQGIPKDGYTAIIEKMLKKAYVITGVDYLANKKDFDSIANTVIYTGSIDEYFGYSLGHLDYRSLRFETEVLEEDNYQGNAVMNYTDRDVPYTRIVEHRWFDPSVKPTNTIITKEYPCEFNVGMERFYPVCDSQNMKLYQKYKELSFKEKHVIFGGRLGEYKYYNMDEVIERAADAYNCSIGRGWKKPIDALNGCLV